MSAAYHRSVGRNSRNAKSKLIALLMVVIMLLSSMVIVLSTDTTVAETPANTNDTSYTANVVYSAGSLDGFTQETATNYHTSSTTKRTVSYAGNVISTEYNPQVWEWGSTGGSYWNGIKVYQAKNTTTGAEPTVVFIGWMYGSYDSETDTVTYLNDQNLAVANDPGDVLVYYGGKWHIGQTATELDTKVDEKGVHTIYICAKWGYLNAISAGTDNQTGSGNKFTNFHIYSADRSIKGDSYVFANSTVRSADLGSPIEIKFTANTIAKGAFILDNVKLYFSFTPGSNHGNGDGFACAGFTGIFGDGIRSEFNDEDEYYQGNIFGNGTESTVNGTKLIVFSGMYSTICGNGHSSKSIVDGNTVIIMHGGTVMDTLLGGDAVSGTVTQDAFIYATGLKMSGDYYEEDIYDDKILNKTYSGYVSENDKVIKAKESTILTGGSNNGSVANTHVYISGNSEVWDVQGAGRRGVSTVGTANLEVSGNAVVKHALNGSITDGNSSEGYGSAKADTSCVKNVNLSVKGNSQVASVFGAGYDTFYYADYASMMGEGKITIDILGGTVGYVYGGGYRGTIGTSAQPISEIAITVSGGRILGDVFGGGRGGVDKTCHNATTGENTWSDAASDFTGYSLVYVNKLSVTVKGDAIIEGSVYGGGESVPVITGYDGAVADRNRTLRNNVASLTANEGVTVDIQSGTVKGDVYGAGKGIDLQGSYAPYIYTIKSAEMVFIPWLKNNSGTNYIDTSQTDRSLTYARVFGNITVNIGADATIGSSDSSEGGNVYGGGAFSQVSNSADNNSARYTIAVNVDGHVYHDVYGGGKGKATSTTLGYVKADTAVDIKSSGSVDSNVYGGGAFGIVNGATSVDVSGIIGTSDSAGSQSVTGNVYGGGQGTSTGTQYTVGQVNSVTKVNLGATATVYGNVYGGGAFGNVSSTTATLPVSTEAGSTVYGNVYGGGYGLSTSTEFGKILGSATVSISGIVDGNVYGGGAFGTVSGSTTVDVYGTVNSNVYGGGQGVETAKDKDSSSGNGNVNSVIHVELMDGATVLGNIYGGGAYGNVTSETSTLKMIINAGSAVGGSVYGGGFGVEGSLLDGKVLGYLALEISGEIGGNVYGGGGYGPVSKDIAMSLNGATVLGTVYAGGQGISGVKSMDGSRNLHIYGDTVINGSVYGGSALGTDGTQGNLSSNATIHIESATIRGSVFGGGFQGITYGNVYLFIGICSIVDDTVANYFDRISFKDEGTSKVRIGQSIYLGGDVGEVDENFVLFNPANSMVKGTGYLRIDARADPDNGDRVADLLISGSIMGSGNSCYTQGETTIYIVGYKSSTPMEAIHRATNVILEDCDITLSGRATVDENKYDFAYNKTFFQDSAYCLFKIDSFVLKNATTIHTSASLDNIGKFTSQNVNGDPTQKYSPGNKLILGSGYSLVFRHQVQDQLVYSDVIGYTVITTRGDDSAFGGYVLGSTSSSGGFIINYDGSYKVADSMVLNSQENCMCWYVAGTYNKEITVTVTGSTPSTATVNLPMMQSGTKFRYTGGTFITSSNTEGYTLSDSAIKSNYFSVLFGTGSPGDLNTVHFENGLYLSEYTSAISSIAEISGLTEHSGAISKNPQMNISVTGNFSGSKYVGYVMIYISEVRAYDLDEDDEYEEFILVNTINIKINLYSSADSLSEAANIAIDTVNGSGSGELMIPSGFPGYSVYVDSVTAVGNSNGLTKLYVQSAKNKDNTLGWTDDLGQFSFYVNNSFSRVEVGTLQGGYNSALKFTVEGYSGIDEENYLVVLKLVKDSDVREMRVNITLKNIPDVEVVFHKIKFGDDFVSLTYMFHYGSRLNESDCPPAGSNFVGWYTDENFVNPFDYSVPLTKDLELWANFMYVVTFDHMDGTTSTAYVSTNDAVIHNLEFPERKGYSFYGWFRDTNFENYWDLEKNIVRGDMTLYAYWVGKDVQVDFAYTLDGGKTYQVIKDAENQPIAGKVQFGKMMNVTVSKDVYLLDAAQERLAKILADDADDKTNVVFLYWVYKTGDYSEASDKSYALYKTSYLSDFDKLTADGDGFKVTLCAYLSNVAIQVVMDPTATVEDANGQNVNVESAVDPPSEFLVYPDGLATVYDSTGSIDLSNYYRGVSDAKLALKKDNATVNGISVVKMINVELTRSSGKFGDYDYSCSATMTIDGVNYTLSGSIHGPTRNGTNKLTAYFTINSDKYLFEDDLKKAEFSNTSVSAWGRSVDCSWGTPTLRESQLVHPTIEYGLSYVLVDGTGREITGITGSFSTSNNKSVCTISNLANVPVSSVTIQPGYVLKIGDKVVTGYTVDTTASTIGNFRNLYLTVSGVYDTVEKGGNVVSGYDLRQVTSNSMQIVLGTKDLVNVSSLKYELFYKVGDSYVKLENFDGRAVFPQKQSTDILYQLVIELNGATLHGYELKGWRLDPAQYTFADGLNGLFISGSTVHLRIMTNPATTGNSDKYLANLYTKQGYVYTLVTSVILSNDDFGKITGTSSTDGVYDLYRLVFKSEWTPIPYTITIAQMENGTTHAKHGAKEFEEIVLYYGDSINLVFAANPGYQFNEWRATGQGVFENAGLVSTTYVVHSDATIYASVVGPQIVTVDIEFDVNELDVGKFKAVEDENGNISYPGVPKLVFSTDGLTADSSFNMKSVTKVGSYYYVSYAGMATLGDHELYLQSPSAGTLYPTGLTVNSERTAANAYYLRTTDLREGESGNLINGKAVVVGNNIVDTDSAIMYFTEYIFVYDPTVTTVSSNKSVYGDVMLQLKAGYYTYRVDGNPIGDASTDSATERFVIRNASKNILGTFMNLQIEGKVAQDKHVINIEYNDGSNTIDTVLNCGLVGYNESYWDKVFKDIPNPVTLTVNSVGKNYSILYWYGLVGYNADDSDHYDYINELTLCQVTGDSPITIIAYVTPQDETAQTFDITVSYQKGDMVFGGSDPGYEAGNTVEVTVLPNGNIMFQLPMREGFTPVLGDYSTTAFEKITLSKDGLLEGKLDVGSAQGDRTMAVRYDRLKVSIQLTEGYNADGTPDPSKQDTVKVPWGWKLDLHYPATNDDPYMEYGKWLVGSGLHGTLSDNIYSVVLEDLGDGDKTIIIDYHKRISAVTVIATYGSLYVDGATELDSRAPGSVTVYAYAGTLLQVTSEPDANGFYMLTLKDKDDVNHRFAVKSIPSKYNCNGWDVSTLKAVSGGYEILGNPAITPLWEPLPLTLTIYTADHLRSISATVGSSNVLLSETVESHEHSGFTYSKVYVKEGIGYNQWVTITLEFDNGYTIDMTEVPGMTPVRGDSLQNYSLRLFLTDHMEIYIHAVECKEVLRMYIADAFDSISGAAKIYELDDCIIGNSYLIPMNSNDGAKPSVDQILNSTLAANCYGDGWYEGINGVLNENNLRIKYDSEKGWCYFIANVPERNMYYYAVSQKAEITGVDEIYDGSEFNAGFVCDVYDSKDVTYTLEYKLNGETVDTSKVDPLKITDVGTYDYTYTFVFTKTFVKVDESDTSAGVNTYARTITGQFSMIVSPGVVYIVSAGGTLLESEIDEASAENYHEYVVLGLTGATVEITWDDDLEFSGVGVYNNGFSYKVTYKNAVYEGDSRTEPEGKIQIYAIAGSIAVVKEGYSSVTINGVSL